MRTFETTDEYIRSKKRMENNYGSSEWTVVERSADGEYALVVREWNDGKRLLSVIERVRVTQDARNPGREHWAPVWGTAIRVGD